MRSVRIKICGITRIADAQAAVDLGADFIGLNFSDRSSRQLDPDRAREIADAIRGKTSIVGVFVNQTLSEIEQIGEKVDLDLIQFHGDESPSDLVPWGDRAVKALRFEGSLDPDDLSEYKTVWGFVIEPRHPDHYGGAGRPWDYAAARKLPRDKPFLLAGGLSPSNVADAVAACHPWGVDVCSGIETEPGIKDRAQMWRFFQQVEHVAN